MQTAKVYQIFIGTAVIVTRSAQINLQATAVASFAIEAFQVASETLRL